MLAGCRARQAQAAQRPGMPGVACRAMDSFARPPAQKPGIARARSVLDLEGKLQAHALSAGKSPISNHDRRKEWRARCNYVRVLLSAAGRASARLWRMPESTPHRRRCGGSATGGSGSAGWQRSAISDPASPSALAICARAGLGRRRAYAQRQQGPRWHMRQDSRAPASARSRCAAQAQGL